MRYWRSLGSDVRPSDGFSNGSLDWYSVQIVVDDDDDQRRTENDVEKEKENNLTVLHEVSPTSAAPSLLQIEMSNSDAVSSHQR